MTVLMWMFDPNCNNSPLQREASQALKHTVITPTYKRNVLKISVWIFGPRQVDIDAQTDVRKKKDVWADLQITETKAHLRMRSLIPTGRLAPNQPDGDSKSNSTGDHIRFESALPHRKTLISSSGMNNWESEPTGAYCNGTPLKNSITVTQF